MKQPRVVLVVDKHRVVGDLLRRALEEGIEGVNVVVVTDPEDALSIASAVVLHCVVWNWSMARNRKGYVQMLKGRSGMANAPVIGMIDSEQERNDASDAGCGPVMCRPLKLEDLVGTVKTCLE